MDALSPRRALGLLALVAASIVSIEVLVTRLLSVMTWYGLAFVVLSLAMLGLTSGSLQATRAREEGLALAPWIASQLVRMSAGLIVATVVIVCIPVQFRPDLSSFGSILLVAGSVSFPLIAGGAVVTRLMSEAPVSLPRLYAVDLASAALGALAPLVLLGPLSAPAALVAIAALLCLGAWWVAPAEARSTPRAIAVGALAVVALSRLVPDAGLVIRYPKGNPNPPGETALFEAWNPLSHVYVSPFTQVPFTYLWSPSPLTPAGVLTAANARIDGEAATPVYEYSQPAQLNVLRFDATTSAHVLRPNGTACVIGVGGGRDLVSALVYGHDRVLGVEINPSIVAMLESVSDRSPTLRNPRVHVRVGDGRAIYAASNVHCTVLQASLVDTWAATGAGAFAHTESTLYTREAWSIFLRRVAPEGVVTFSRWYDPSHVSETSRLLSLAIASLLDRGAANPADHIALIASGPVATILVSPSPLTPDDLAALHDLEQRLQFVLLLAPDQAPRDPLLRTLLRAHSIAELSRAGDAHGLDTSPPTDDRPFFFQLLSARAWLHPIDAMQTAQGSSGVLAGNATAMFELLVTFLAVVLVGLVLLGPTLAKAAREERPPLPSARATVYFGALGAGFMTAEIALVQRMHVVLGHPTYALVIVLAGMLVATGLGSALSERLIRTRAHVRVAAMVAAVVLAVIPFAVVRTLAARTLDAPFWIRALWTGGTAALVGLVLGTLFPSGIRYVSRTRGAPVALAVNGATSVLGSVAATTVSVWAGIPTTFVLAGVIYLLAAWASPVSWPAVSDDADRP